MYTMVDENEVMTMGSARTSDVDPNALYRNENRFDRLVDSGDEVQSIVECGITNTQVADKEMSLGETEDGGSVLCGKNPLVTGLAPTTKSVDRHISVLIHQPDTNLYFDQWKRKMNSKSAVKKLRMALEELLPRLMGGRDYAGAAKVLEIMYHRFPVAPSLCVEASLEILRRQPDYRNDLLEFYEAALNVEHIDKGLILKEMWLFYIGHGDFYEAYHLYQDKILLIEEFDNDARLLATFGILCYWLMLIESKEIRDTLKREETDCDEYENGDVSPPIGDTFFASENIESVIESNFLFKTPIGAHILYQHATNAMRRAGALTPNSAMFVEYYVQLLVLVGDIQPACDYLEKFYHLNPDNPHGPRMLARFLGCYYPESVDAQVTVLSRWMKNDPSCCYPLEKLLELSSAGAVSSFALTNVLVDALDTCGSDLYVMKNPNLASTLWRNLAELVAAMEEDEFLSDQVEGNDYNFSHQVTLADLGAQRLWWKRIYLAKPSTVEEVVAIAKHDSFLLEISIYRAAVAERLFSGIIPVTEALRSAMASLDVTSNTRHIRLFKSFFPNPSTITPNVATFCRPFHTKGLIRLIVDEDNNDQRKLLLPVFKGSSDSIHVIDRKSILDNETVGEKSEVVVTRFGKSESIDPQLVEELYEALDTEISDSSRKTRINQRKRKIGAISTTTPTLIPAFAYMVEEEVYNNPDATLRHIYSTIYLKLRRSDMLVPTSKSVACCIDFFRKRYRQNQEDYGHGGLLMRYEEFIVTYIRRKGVNSFDRINIDAAKVVSEMKRLLPSPHPHLPDAKIVKETICRKVPMLLRGRRLQLIELKKILLPILRQLVYIDDKLFVDAVYSVIKRNRLLGVLTYVDIKHAVQNMLPMHYYRVLQNMRPLLLKRITSPAFRVDCNTAEEILKKIKKKKPMVEEIKALLWVERYEALHGRFIYDKDPPAMTVKNIGIDSA
ncbi:putative TATA box-binding protein-associated factor RNA polymerase I subunit A [Plasmopara halstedii]